MDKSKSGFVTGSLCRVKNKEPDIYRELSGNVCSIPSITLPPCAYIINGLTYKYRLLIAHYHENPAIKSEVLFQHNFFLQAVIKPGTTELTFSHSLVFVSTREMDEVAELCTYKYGLVEVCRIQSHVDGAVEDSQ